MKRLTITLTCVLLLSVAAKAQVSDYSQLRTNSWSLYGLGGVSTATGDRLFGNVNPSPDTFLAPMGGAGVTYNLRPWVRFNLGYEASKFRREQCLTKVQADGSSYRSLDMAYNDVELNADFNLAQIFREKGTSGRFNLYLGTGLGCMFTYGADYTVRMGENITESTSTMNDNYTFNPWLKAENDRIGRDILYVPANLSAEYDITPRFTVGLRGSVKYILDDDARDIPTLTESLGALLRVNFLGSKHAYTSKSRRIGSLENDLTAAVSDIDALTSKNNQLSSDLAAKEAENAELKKCLDDLEKRLEDCGADKETVRRLREEIRDLKAKQFTVYFDNASAKLSRKAKATIAEAAKAINDDPEALSLITASCSTPGGEAYNKELSDKRAEAVRAALIDNGVSENRITDIISLGKEGMTNSPSCRRAIIDVR